MQQKKNFEQMKADLCVKSNALLKDRIYKIDQQCRALRLKLKTTGDCLLKKCEPIEGHAVFWSLVQQKKAHILDEVQIILSLAEQNETGQQGFTPTLLPLPLRLSLPTYDPTWLGEGRGITPLHKAVAWAAQSQVPTGVGELPSNLTGPGLRLTGRVERAPLDKIKGGTKEEEFSCIVSQEMEISALFNLSCSGPDALEEINLKLKDNVKAVLLDRAHLLQVEVLLERLTKQVEQLDVRILQQ